MIKRSVRMFYTLLLILAFSLTLGSPSIPAKDKPINSPADKGQLQSGLNRSTRQVTLHPVLTDRRNQGAAVNESLLVDLKFTSDSESQARYTLSATEWQWMVRKPGNYAAKCLTGTITSNVDVVIHFEGFEDLSSSNLPAQYLETYYGATLLDLTVGEVVWYGASDFNGQYLIIPSIPGPPNLVYWRLWNKVSVKNQTSADEYQDDAVISFGIMNGVAWIEP